MIANSAEREKLSVLSDRAICWDRMLFSVKESVYKALFPITGRWLGFEEVSVTIYPSDATFSARLMVDSPIRTICGQFVAAHGHILTAAIIANSN